MKLSYLMFMGILSILIFRPSTAQIIVDSKADIANVDFFLENEELIITYDLINTKPNDRFIIDVKILNSEGKPINAKSFTGSVGENITGGPRKRIVWKISEDMAYLNDQIYIELEATHQNPRIIQPTSKGMAMLYSTIFPGWGSAKTTLKGSHIMKGFASYGCLAGSLYYRSQSQTSYENYQGSSSSSERDDYYNQSEKEKQTSQVLLYTAGAIWLLDYITILASENRSRQSGFKSKLVYFKPGYDIKGSYPSISLVYNF